MKIEKIIFANEFHNNIYTHTVKFLEYTIFYSGWWIAYKTENKSLETKIVKLW